MYSGVPGSSPAFAVGLILPAFREAATFAVATEELLDKTVRLVRLLTVPERVLGGQPLLGRRNRTFDLLQRVAAEPLVAERPSYVCCRCHLVEGIEAERLRGLVEGSRSRLLHQPRAYFHRILPREIERSKILGLGNPAGR